MLLDFTDDKSILIRKPLPTPVLNQFFVFIGSDDAKMIKYFHAWTWISTL